MKHKQKKFLCWFHVSYLVGLFFLPHNRKITCHHTGMQLFSYPAQPWLCLTPSTCIYWARIYCHVSETLRNHLPGHSMNQVREPAQLTTNPFFHWLFFRWWVHHAALQTPVQLMRKVGKKNLKNKRKPNPNTPTNQYPGQGGGTGRTASCSSASSRHPPELELLLQELQKWWFSEFTWNIYETHQKALKPYSKLNKCVLLGEIHYREQLL